MGDTSEVAIPVITGTIVSAAPASVREVDPGRWDEHAAWDAAVEFWLKSLKSQHSKIAYKRDITLWHDWCHENGVPLDNARRADVDAWRETLAGKPATVARRLSAVSSFYGYWLTEEMVARNPVTKTGRPKVSPEPVSISLTLQQATDLLAYADDLEDQRPGVIIRLLAQAGLRVSELTAARVSDLSMSGGHHVLTVTRKGGGTQQLAVAGDTYDRIAAYLGDRAEGYLLGPPTTRLGQARSEAGRKGAASQWGDKIRNDGRMDRSYVRQLLRRLAREAGLPPEVCARMHPHVLRHSAATLLAADGVPPHEIQRLLGHAGLGTTQRYIHHAESLDASPVYRLARLLAR